jgi:hypothetical protein
MKLSDRETRVPHGAFQAELTLSTGFCEQVLSANSGLSHLACSSGIFGSQNNIFEEQRWHLNAVIAEFQRGISTSCFALRKPALFATGS